MTQKPDLTAGNQSKATMLHRVALAAILTGGALLRLWDLGTKSLWRDEIETMFFSIAPLKEIVTRALEIPFIPIPPLYFFVTHFFLKINDSHAVLRLPAAISSIATLVLLYLFARRMFGGATALLSVFLLAVSPFQIYYAQEARSYAFLMMLSLLSLIVLEKCVDGSRRWFFLWGALCLCLLYTHHFAALVVGTQALIALILFFTADGGSHAIPRSGLGRPGWKTFLIAYALSGAAIFVLWQPVFTHLVSGVSGPRGMRGFSLTPHFSLQAMETMAGLMGLGTRNGALAVTLLAAVGLIPLARRDRRGLIVSFLWLLPPALLLFFGRFAHVFRVRYLIYVIPLYLLMAARGSRVLDTLIGRAWVGISGRNPRRHAPPVFTILFVAAALFWVYPYQRGYFREEKQNWKAAAAFLQKASGPEDYIMATGKGDETNLHTFIMEEYAGLGERTVILHVNYDYLPWLTNLLEKRRPIWYATTERRDPEKYRNKYPFIRYADKVRGLGYTVFPPLIFGTGTNLTDLEAEYLAQARYKPVKVTLVRPEMLSAAQVEGETRRLLSLAGSIPRSFVDPGPTLAHLREQGAGIPTPDASP